ncbi:hypothetical protein [Nisaea nitritireducens]|uniref:hypothetical protein n=1 Tax=Nisaea nitritireducens TaxID=568392 RepID=UPI001866087D|nr:hypothetical protein [Nisaea nitritireducens]
MAANLPDSDENKKRAEPGWLLPAKIAVVVMGLMILGGLGVIAYTVATRLSGGDEKPVAAPAAPAAVQAEAPTVRQVATGFGTIDVAIPNGARLGAVQFDAGRMILRMNLQNSKVRLLVYDLATGKELGVFNITREK